ncbi:hypothetical protein PR003_g25729 [Phytophthora rubi]|uniref:Uncharacterized protein n=1 Tax=Phytophthora rubi TaxID=129364 RepID=A0A6A3I2U3_9STRA|nr:hypothetical protein PR002_g25111 [Phytophthora rubi]KAE8978738.1 hypothetical protein PR001_g24757 [Phytophthora rubi]KAE9288749.1 hypothetical protein PR003_g25729 [Phytophthora rubi]
MLRVSSSAQLRTAIAAIAYSSALMSGMASPPSVRGNTAKSASSHARTPVTSETNCPCHTKFLILAAISFTSSVVGHSCRAIYSKLGTITALATMLR